MFTLIEFVILYVPVVLLFMCMAYVYSENTFLKLEYLWYLIMPIISTIVLMFNSKYHLYYKQYNLDGSFEIQEIMDINELELIKKL